MGIEVDFKDFEENHKKFGTEFPMLKISRKRLLSWPKICNFDPDAVCAGSQETLVSWAMSYNYLWCRCKFMKRCCFALFNIFSVIHHRQHTIISWFFIPLPFNSANINLPRGRYFLIHLINDERMSVFHKNSGHIVKSIPFRFPWGNLKSLLIE